MNPRKYILPSLLKKDVAETLLHQAAYALGRIAEATRILALQQALQTAADFKVRRAAALALGQLKDPRYVAAFIFALKDADYGVRMEAAFALGQLRDQSIIAVPALSTVLLKDDSEWVRAAAATALGQINTYATFGAIIQAIETEKNMWVRAAVCRVLLVLKA